MQAPTEDSASPSTGGGQPPGSSTPPETGVGLGSPPAGASDAGTGTRSATDSGTPASKDASSTPPTSSSDAEAAPASDAGGGTSTGVSTGADGFPKDEPVDTMQMGPHAFDKYTMGLDNPTYASSIMYYPTDATPPFASTVFSPGFTATKEQYEMFLGPLLASHGIAILLTTPTTTGDFPQQRGEDLAAAVDQIKTENEREGSPLKGKLAVDRVCVTGHSMGGGGTLWAASSLGDKVKCAVPLQPWQPGQSFEKIVSPIMFIAAQNDTVADVASNAATFYKSIPDSVPKYYVEFAGASHFLSTNDLGTAYDVQSKYMIAFYKTYLEDDKRYLEVLNAAMPMEISKYEHKP